MDNLKLPAFPVKLQSGETLMSVAPQDGFTKLEMASLMIAQGMVAGIGQNAIVYQSVASSCVLLAKSVLEKANK